MAEVVFGTIRGYDAEAQTADVEIVGYPTSQVRGVPVAWHIADDLLGDGVRCLIVLRSGMEAKDGVVVAVFGTWG